MAHTVINLKLGRIFIWIQIGGKVEPIQRNSYLNKLILRLENGLI